MEFLNHGLVHRLNQTIKYIAENYDLKLTESKLDDVIRIYNCDAIIIKENMQDDASNPRWTRTKLILETARKMKQLIENAEFRVDQKTGALVNYKPSENGDESISSRPDLYWRGNDKQDTDELVIPNPLSAEEIDAAAKAMGKGGAEKPEVEPAGGTGMYVGVKTPGSQDTVINHKDGEDIAVSAEMSDTGVVKPVTKTARSAERPDGTENPNSIFTQKGGKVSDKHQSAKKSIVAGSENKVVESMTDKNHILMLAESEIEKAQIVMAVNNEIVEKLQRDAEKMGNMKVDILGPIVERIKAEHGLEAADNFRDTITRLINTALDAVLVAKDQIHTETLKLTGDISSAPGLEQDLGMEAGLDAGAEEIADPLAGAEMEMGDEFAEDPALDMEALPAEREMKESAKPKRLGVMLESTKGTVGSKYFDNKEQMRSWLNENKDRIAKVHKILKD